VVLADQELWAGSAFIAAQTPTSGGE